MKTKYEQFVEGLKRMAAKYLRWLWKLMAGTWLCAMCYGISQHTPLHTLVSVSLVAAVLILAAGSVLFAVLMALESAVRMLAECLRGKKLTADAEDPTEGRLLYLTQYRKEY